MNERAHVSQAIRAAPHRATAPTLAVRADQAAESLGISVSTFLSLVSEGKMPKAVPIPNHRGLALYDFKAVENAWRALAAAAVDSEPNEWDDES